MLYCFGFAQYLLNWGWVGSVIRRTAIKKITDFLILRLNILLNKTDNNRIVYVNVEEI